MKKYLALIVLAISICLIAGCGKSASSEVKQKTEKKQVKIEDHIKGLEEDLYVQEGSEEVDLSKALEADNSIEKIEIDDKDVDYKKAGEYDVVCKVTFKDSETALVRKTIKVKVVTADEAKKLADSGKKVCVSKGEILKKSEESKEEAKEETKEEKTEEKTEEKKEEPKKEKEASSSNSSSGAAASSSQKPASSSGSSSGSSSSGSSQPSKPAHTHNWVAITVQQPVYETQPVYEQQPVYEWVSVCNGCGAISPSTAHIKQHVLNGENGSTSTKQVQTGTQTVQVGTKQVQTGTKTVVTGYKCSGCGATK